MKKKRRVTHKKASKKTGHSRSSARTHQKVLRKHHQKPYRKRHIGLLAAAVAVFFVSILLLAAQNLSETSLFKSNDRLENSFTVVKSGYGLSLAVDLNIFEIEATELTEAGRIKRVEEADLREAKDINSVIISPRPRAVEPRFAASSLALKIDTSTNRFDNARDDKANEELADHEVAAKINTLSDSADLGVEKVFSGEEQIDGRKVVKSVYQHTVKTIKSLKDVHTYSIQWAGVVDGRTFTMAIGGLTTSSEIPYPYQPIIDSLNIAGDLTAGIFAVPRIQLSQAVLGSSTLDSSYIADLVSPAVVKVYHATCADLKIGSRLLVRDSCLGGTGSGFIISKDGYIGTNGHVVVLDPETMFLYSAIYSPAVMVRALEIVGATPSQISYILSNVNAYLSQLQYFMQAHAKDPLFSYQDKKEKIYVATGKEPVEFDNYDTFFGDNQNSTHVVSAELIDYDYDNSDLYSEKGFSSSDVAILKADLTDAPVATLHAGAINNNQVLTVLGFPGDAENPLVDNSTLAVSTSNGTVSAVREASGDQATIYQSDVDASHGNSGGPAITAEGDVFGLLTYVFQSASREDSAKTYIRDIEDLKELLTKNNIALDTESDTQAQWEKGLQHFSTSRFSKSIGNFNKVLEAFPSHRLAAQYINNANKEIEAGNDIKDFPLVLVAGIAVGLLGAGGAGFLIVRHHKHHLLYKKAQGGVAAPTQTPPAPSPAMPWQQTQPPTATASPAPPPTPQSGDVITPTTNNQITGHNNQA